MSTASWHLRLCGLQSARMRECPSFPAPQAELMRAIYTKEMQWTVRDHGDGAARAAHDLLHNPRWV